MDILIVFAHPDDETVFIGGTAALLSERGARVHYVCATRGEGGEVGEPPVCAAHELGEVRSRELACAVHALGGASLDFLGYVDPPVDADGNGRAFAADPKQLAKHIAQAASACQAQAMISHGSSGEYGHPAHSLLHQAALRASQGSPGACLPLYTFSADFPGHPRRDRSANRNDPADFVIDVRPWMPVKLAAAHCHRTQEALFVRRASRLAGHLVPLADVLMSVESLHRAWPTCEGRPEDALADFLRNRCGEALLASPAGWDEGQA
jgi:LmbE family N-acetylglucosaminyl deacetylase